MDPSDEITSKGTNLVEEKEPPVNQPSKSRGHPNSPPWRKVLVYDCDKETVRVKSEKDISQLRASIAHVQS